MKQSLVVLQIVIATLLVAAIILQNKSEGIGRAMGTETAAFSTRRGIEKFLFYGTILLIAGFLVVSVLNFVT